MTRCLYNNLLEGFKSKTNLITFGRKENGSSSLHHVYWITQFGCHVGYKLLQRYHKIVYIVRDYWWGKNLLHSVWFIHQRLNHDPGFNLKMHGLLFLKSWFAIALIVIQAYNLLCSDAYFALYTLVNNFIIMET